MDIYIYVPTVQIKPDLHRSSFSHPNFQKNIVSTFQSRLFFHSWYPPRETPVYYLNNTAQRLPPISGILISPRGPVAKGGRINSTWFLRETICDLYIRQSICHLSQTMQQKRHHALRIAPDWWLMGFTNETWQEVHCGLHICQGRFARCRWCACASCSAPRYLTLHYLTSPYLTLH